MIDTPVNLAALPYPNIDPVAIALGPVDIPWYGPAHLAIRWYGLAYLAGLVLGWLYMRRLAGSPSLWSGASPVRPTQIDDFLIWATLGVVVGGRLGFVVFYQPEFFLANPLEIFAIWGGGMSFHGGLVGVGIATWFFARYNGIPAFSLMDLCAAAVPFGLFFGRIANFINGEIYGRLTDVPWAVVFPQRVLEAGHALGPRHPTQIYEALLEGVVLFVALRYLTHYRGALMRPGMVVGAFLMIYGAARIFVEFAGKIWRYDFSVLGIEISVGTVYSLPMIALGLYFVMRAMRHEKLATQ